MIKLFHIPTYKVDTAKFNHPLHGDIVDEFTENFCKYVGVKYGCPVDCCTNAIFLVALCNDVEFKVPTIMTPVVPQALIHTKQDFKYTDDIDWVGHSYYLYRGDFDIIDSAQEVDKRSLRENDIIMYSFYPTKPVSGIDGGMICSNNKKIIDYFRMLSNQGTISDTNSWNNRRYVDIGWKMYLNSFQAYIANENLKRLDEKREQLKKVCDIYNNELGYENYSHHLYRVNVKDNKMFLNYMKDNNIICGIHYECCHKIYPRFYQDLPQSELAEKQTVSIPFHEKLTKKEIWKVIRCTKTSGQLLQSN